jgi:hypothetical protein
VPWFSFVKTFSQRSVLAICMLLLLLPEGRTGKILERSKVMHWREKQFHCFVFKVLKKPHEKRTYCTDSAQCSTAQPLCTVHCLCSLKYSEYVNMAVSCSDVGPMFVCVCVCVWGQELCDWSIPSSPYKCLNCIVQVSVLCGKSKTLQFVRAKQSDREETDRK